MIIDEGLQCTHVARALARLQQPILANIRTMLIELSLVLLRRQQQVSHFALSGKTWLTIISGAICKSMSASVLGKHKVVLSC